MKRYKTVDLIDLSAVRVSVIAFQCNECGSLIGNTEIHDWWHEEMEIKYSHQTS